jgi:hypothetical protein
MAKFLDDYNGRSETIRTTSLLTLNTCQFLKEILYCGVRYLIINNLDVWVSM